MKELTKKIEDILRQGLNRAATRLERVSGVNWRISNIKVGPFKPKDEDSICVYLRIDGDWYLASLLAVFEKDVHTIFKSFIRDYLPQFNTSEIIEFFINELGNIVITSSISELANQLGIKIIPEPPKTIKGKESFIVENILLYAEKRGINTVLSSQVTLTVKDEIIIDIYYLLSNELIEKLR